MKKLMFFVLASILLFSLVGLASAEVGKLTAYVVESGQGNENGVQKMGDSQMVGNDSDAHGCIGSAGYSWCEERGECIRVWETNCTQLELKDRVKTNMNLTSLKENNKTINVALMSNGKNAMIKVMPSTASATAIARLGIKNCNESEGCTIILKETGTGNQTKATYEVKAEKQARVLGLFKTKMLVEAQVDAETGDVIQTKKPWWAFLAKEE